MAETETVAATETAETVDTSQETLKTTETEVTDEQAQKYLETGGDEDAINKVEKQDTKVEKEVVKEEKKPETPKFVPLAALHEERGKRKEIQKKVELMEQRFNELLERSKPKEPDVPAFDVDPAAHLKHQQETLSKSVEEQRRFIEQQQLAAQEQARANHVISLYRTKAAEFSKQTTDFGDAYKFLVDGRTQEFAALGYPSETIPQLIAQDEFLIVSKALEDESNPAERIYKLAQARGYKKVEPKPEKKLEDVERGVKASKSLSSVAGAGGKGLTLEAIADMPDEDFKKLSYEEIAKLAGG